MDVEIKNGGAFRAGRQGFQHGDGDVVQIAKAHRPVAQGVVAGRAHEAENIFAVARGFQRIQRGGDGGAGKRDDVFVKRRVGVKILRFVQAGEMPRGVRAQNRRVIHAGRRRPNDGQFILAAQQVECAGDAGRAFGMALARIAGAAFVGDDFHCHTDIVSKRCGRNKL